MISFTTLIDVAELAAHFQNPDWIILDSRFSIDDPSRGWHSYLKAHIPGAQYVHLEGDLSGPVIPGQTGRHPLPSVERAGQVCARLGVGPGVQVVVYDDAGGALPAARLWWMLRRLGHESVAVLNGGWQAWDADAHPTRDGMEVRPPQDFTPAVSDWGEATIDEIDRLRHDPAYRLFDSRSEERYHGRNETVYPLAGHIPGALSAPYADNLDAAGFFRPADDLRRRFEKLLDGLPAERAVFYCGSGVTANANLLALAAAGLGEARLFPGSWSEWIASGGREIAV
jgi:thiosulfate/3-mercaptopyruvate sulfurtransferase